jgi:hypothetical protein
MLPFLTGPYWPEIDIDDVVFAASAGDQDS